MKKIINERMLCIPPHLSTNWENIGALYVKDGVLIVTLIDGDLVKISELSDEDISLIFSTHAQFLSEEPIPHQESKQDTSPIEQLEELGEALKSKEGSPFRLAFGAFDNLGTAMQHNPSQSDLPDLPSEIIEKITAITSIVSPDDLQGAPEPEPHCNCIHCQIARAIHQGLHPQESIKQEEEEEVTDEDLVFQQWDIEQTGDKLFTLINRLDPDEQYRVFLGNPIGCTCGNKNCEHIVAVLKS